MAILVVSAVNIENSNLPLSLAHIGELQAHSYEQALEYCYQVVVKSNIFPSLNEAINVLLEMGKQRFGMEIGLVSRPISDSVYEVQAFNSQEEPFYVGQHIATADFLCHQVFRESCILEKSNLKEQSNMVSPLAYSGISIKSYVGVPVNAQTAPRGVLCFISSNYRLNMLSEEDKCLLQHLADGIGFLADQQKTQAQRKNIDSTMFVNGSLSTLDEYLVQAKLPELYGIPGRVVDVLEARIGEMPLGIGHVAADLNMSKRTLQRRLQQQNVNFAELRDQIRYHFAIEFLVKDLRSIDSISIALDFSDRTSFTNAFKRWTGMSPSTFRKLFRDFI